MAGYDSEKCLRALHICQVGWLISINHTERHPIHDKPTNQLCIKLFLLIRYDALEVEMLDKGVWPASLWELSLTLMLACQGWCPLANPAQCNVECLWCTQKNLHWVIKTYVQQMELEISAPPATAGLPAVSMTAASYDHMMHLASAETCPMCQARDIHDGRPFIALH